MGKEVSRAAKRDHTDMPWPGSGEDPAAFTLAVVTASADWYQPMARGIAQERRATEAQCIFEHVENLGFGDRSHRGKADRALHAYSRRRECLRARLGDCRILEIQFEPVADRLARSKTETEPPLPPPQPGCRRRCRSPRGRFSLTGGADLSVAVSAAC
jgi:hypothetical protein